MSIGTIVEALFGLIVVMGLAGIIFFRVKIGSTSSEDKIAGAYRRNSLVIAFIVVFFIFVWFTRITEQGLLEGQFQGMKALAIIGTFMIGIASVFLIFYGSFRKKKR